MDKISENYLEEQKRLHTNINYGTASLQHVTTIKNLLINTKLKTLSDYGAGKKNLQKGLLNSGFTDFNYFAYDPAFPEYGQPVAADLVCCIDVMEHIENEFLEVVLDEIKSITLKLCYFSIATSPAQKKLSDGRNAHLIQKPARWWLPKLCERFHIEHLKVATDNFIVLCKSIK